MHGGSQRLQSGDREDRPPVSADAIVRLKQHLPTTARQPGADGKSDLLKTTGVDSTMLICHRQHSPAPSDSQ
jgi:hypothetical protein